MFFPARLVVLAAVLLAACAKKEDSTAMPACAGSISLTLNGTTSTQTDGVVAVLLGGKFMGITDDNLDAKVGDSESMDVAVGTVKTVFVRFVVGGVSYARTRSTNGGVQLTITAYDGSTLSGTFRGNVYRDGDSTNPVVPVSGSFTTKCLQKM